MPFVDSNGIRLYYEERGTGDPLLLLMGITAPGSRVAEACRRLEQGVSLHHP